jgi:glycosyltransferase involved in cell wall biosynthesis
VAEGDPRLAIIVACYEDGATVRETIDSLRDEPETELIVVDDGSTDPTTLAILDALERQGTRILHQENAGPSAAWMAGLRATTAPYVLPFSSDDLLVHGATGILADALDANPDAAVAWGDMQSFGMANAYIPSAPALCPWHVTYLNPIPAIAAFRRDRLLEAGGWRLRKGIEDWDLWMRMAAGGMGGVHVPTSIFRYRRDAGGRFRGRVPVYEGFYEQLRQRNLQLFARRPGTKRESPAPRAVKALLPLIDRVPFASRLLKVQLCELVTLLFWSAGIRETVRIVLQGILFRARLRMAPELPNPLSRRSAHGPHPG